MARLFEKGYKLPFTYDPGSDFIFDANNDLVGMFLLENAPIVCQVAVNWINDGKGQSEDFEYCKDLQVIEWSGDGFLIIRGFGYLTGTGGLNLSEEEADAIQDDLGAFIVERLSKK